MNPRLPITVLIATKNERINIRRCLESLAPAERVILLDSGSIDGTDKVAQEAGAEIVQFSYKGGYPKKRQWALSTLELRSPWILLLDADEVIPGELWNEIRQAIQSQNACTGYLIRKRFHFLGKRFNFGGFSHHALLLFQSGRASFERIVEDTPAALDMEVHERVIVDGTIGTLRNPLIHEDFKGLEAYIDRHNKYSTWEAHVRSQYLKTGRWGKQVVTPRLLGNTQERRRSLKAIAIQMPFEPQLWFFYHYFLCFGFLEGRAGLIASKLRMAYISQVRAKMYEVRVRENDNSDFSNTSSREPNPERSHRLSPLPPSRSPLVDSGGEGGDILGGTQT